MVIKSTNKLTLLVAANLFNKLSIQRCRFVLRVDFMGENLEDLSYGETGARRYACERGPAARRHPRVFSRLRRALGPLRRLFEIVLLLCRQTRHRVSKTADGFFCAGPVGGYDDRISGLDAELEEGDQVSGIRRFVAAADLQRAFP